MKELSLHIMDIAQNSIRAKASLIEIAIDEQSSTNSYIICIKDNGCGMDKETLLQCVDPFFTSRTTRKIGLGVPLIKQNAELTGGSFNISSTLHEGTVLSASFSLNHIDRAELGDIAGVITLLAGANPTIDFVYNHTVDSNNYSFDTREIKQLLDDIPISNPEMMRNLKEMINENINEINASK